MRLIFLPALFFLSLANATIKVAVTIDDLPTASPLPRGVTWEAVASKMLLALKQHQVPEAYAFINAGKVTPENGTFEVLRLWKAAGYLFGNHTFLHEDLNKQSVKQFRKTIFRNEPMLRKLMGDKNWRLFRYPFLHEGNSKAKRNAIRKFLRRHQYTIAQVTINFEDYSWNPPYTRCMNQNNLKSVEWLKKTFLQNSVEMLERSVHLSKALFQRDISHILLLHIGGLDAEALDSLLTSYKNLGVEFIPLSEAVKDEVYSIDPGIVGEWGSEFPYQILKSRNLTLKDVGMVPYTGYPKEELETICQ